MKYYKDLTEEEIDNLSHYEFLDVMLNEDVTEINIRNRQISTRVNHTVCLTMVGIMVLSFGFNLYTLLSFVPALITLLFAVISYRKREVNYVSLKLNIALAKTSGLVDDDNFDIIQDHLDRVIGCETIFSKLFL
jgi:hypothetical protein